MPCRPTMTPRPYVHGQDRSSPDGLRDVVLHRVEAAAELQLRLLRRLEHLEADMVGELGRLGGSWRAVAAHTVAQRGTAVKSEIFHMQGRCA